jgi:multiple sugar transport system permease protein
VEAGFMARSERLSVPAVELNINNQHAKRGFFSSENPWLWVAPATLILLLYSLFPLLYNLYYSFQVWSTQQHRWIISRNGPFTNWENIFFADARFGNSLVVTFQYTIAALVIELLLGLFIALLLDAKPYGSGLMQTLMMLPMVTAPAVAGLIFRLLEHSEFGLLSYYAYSTGLLTKQEPLLGGSGQYALLGILLVDIWQWTPFFTLIILAGLKSVPAELLEAAEVDGAAWWSRLTRIKIPLLFGVITVGVLFRLVDLYKAFDYIVIMTSGGPALKTETVSYYSYVNTFQQVKWGYGAAIGVFIMLLGWITAFIYQRAFRVRW